MKTLYCLLTIFVFLFMASCKNSDETVNSSNNNPVKDWTMDYHYYYNGTWFCNNPVPCSFDFISDTVDLTKSDSIRIYMVYSSVRNNSLEVLKFPEYGQLFSYVFPDSTTGKIDRIFTSFKAKVFFDFAFEVGTRFSVDTLKIFKK